MKNAIIIFVRNPEKGKVKTRLARGIGDDKALEVYRTLLTITHDLTARIDADRFVFYTDKVEEQDLWETSLFKKMIQKNGDLGERMSHAFELLLGQGYEKVVIIGSDCPELNPAIMNEAFDSLDRYPACIGPADDGGYYLLGLNGLIPELFKDKNWSTATVFGDTMADLEKTGKKAFILPILSDIDTIEDLLKFKGKPYFANIAL